MTRILRLRLVTLAGALVLAFGLVSGVSAASEPTPSAVPLTLEAGPKASINHPALARLIEIGVLPPQARVVLTDILADDGKSRHAGFICRRIAQDPAAAPADLVERCREFVAGLGEASTPGAQACRRVAALGAEAPADLVERCREWLAGQEEMSKPALEVCRRIANATDVDAGLVERCRALLEAAGDDARERVRPRGERPERFERFERFERPALGRPALERLGRGS